MSQKVIIIGATSGIGRRLAEKYAQRGYSVGVTGRRMELLLSLQQQFPQQIHFACFDFIADDAPVQLLSLTERLEGLDLLIISAGGGDVSKAADWKLDKWVVETNVIGFVQAANWAFNYFVQQGHGQLVTISSIAAYRGSGVATAYNAAKAFQSSYFEGLAIKTKYLQKDITITCIEPGFVATKMAKSKKLFWVVPVDKAVQQIMHAIDKKKSKAFISRRWRLIAVVLKWMPFWILKKIG